MVRDKTLLLVCWPLRIKTRIPSLTKTKPTPRRSLMKAVTKEEVKMSRWKSMLTMVRMKIEMAKVMLGRVD